MRRTTELCAIGMTAVLLGGLAPGMSAPAAATGQGAKRASEVFPVPADGIFRFSGRGWGHGRGMSQWGAYQAATEGVSFRKILAFYYPRTSLAKAGSTRIRVLLTSDTGRDLVVRATPTLSAAVGDAPSRRLAAKPAGCGTEATSWRAGATAAGLRLAAYCKGWRTVSTTAAATIRFSTPAGIVGTNNDSVRRGYRGWVSAIRTGPSSVIVVNSVPVERYLRTVVPAETSASWPREALRAQAVAARTYAATEASSRKGGLFDVYDSTRSQVYLAGFAYDASWRVVVTREHPRTNAAIQDTEGLQVMSGGVPVLTQFSSSNGGATAGSPVPYMVASVDSWDARANRNPRRTWTDTISARTLASRFPSVGKVQSLEVAQRQGVGPWGGRVLDLRIVGDRGSRTVSGDTAIRAALGTNSSLLTVSTPG
jgi:stage II sporulation protein D